MLSLSHGVASCRIATGYIGSVFILKNLTLSVSLSYVSKVLTIYNELVQGVGLDSCQWLAFASYRRAAAAHPVSLTFPTSLFVHP